MAGAGRARVGSRDLTLSLSGAHIGLLAFSALLVLTGAFGRGFSKLEIGFSWLHPTELILLVVVVAAVAHVGPRAAFERIRATGVLVPLALLWLFGAIASLRGLADWGFSLVLHDIGLVEYSLVLPIVALLVASREELAWLVRALALSGLLAIVVQALALWTPLQWDVGGELGLVAVASGMYISIYVAWVIARRAAGATLPWWQYAIATLGVALVVIGLARAAWLGLLVAVVVAAALAPAGRRAGAWAAIGAVVALGVVLSVPAEEVQFGEPRVVTTTVSEGDGTTGDSTGPGTGDTNVIGEVGASFDADSTGGQAANTRWRLAYWDFMLGESAHNPIGVGFGKPSAFVWSGVNYDRRTGDPLDPFDVTAPHNSFVNVAYRMGLLAVLAIAVIVGVALVRLVRMARSTEGEDRALAIWLIGLIGLTGAVASLSVALEGPFLGIFFWTALALGLIAPAIVRDGSPAPAA